VLDTCHRASGSRAPPSDHRDRRAQRRSCSGIITPMTRSKAITIVWSAKTSACAS